MDNKLTHRDYIAGLPALSLATFLAECEESVTAQQVAAWFHLNDQENESTFQRLIEEGYLSLRDDRTKQAREMIKTSKALAIEQLAPPATLSILDTNNIILNLLEAVNEVNSNPATAHRIAVVSLIGAFVNGSQGPYSMVESIIEIEPKTHATDVQAGLEKLAHDYAVAHLGEDFKLNGSCPHYISIHRIKEHLWMAHKHLSLRFAIKGINNSLPS